MPSGTPHERACFRRPEFVSDFISYDVLPPLTAQRMMTTAFPLADGQWRLRRITVLNRIHFGWSSIVTPRGQRRALVLLNVAYLAELTVENAVMVDAASSALFPGRRAKGHLGLAEFSADLIPVKKQDTPSSAMSDTGMRDLGWLPEQHTDGKTRYLRTTMTDGVVDLDEQDRDFTGI